MIKPRELTTIQQNSFSNRVVTSWNELPDDVVLADSLNLFKNKLETFLQFKVFKYRNYL